MYEQCKLGVTYCTVALVKSLLLQHFKESQHASVLYIKLWFVCKHTVTYKS